MQKIASFIVLLLAGASAAIPILGQKAGQESILLHARMAEDGGWSLETLAEGEQLYAQNCAACHGEDGQGDGVMAEALAGQAGKEHSLEIDGHQMVHPDDFIDPAALLRASPAVLQGKTIRGGMGTGMP